MKIGVMADSHDNLPAIGKAVSLFNDAGVGLVIHAGDLVAPFVAEPLRYLKADFIAVFGNNDGERFGLHTVFGGRIHRPPHPFSFAERRILILHEPDNLDALAISGKFDGIVYGHTHEPDVRRRPVPVINPGECGGWVTGRRTVAVWDPDSGQVDIIPV
ncbi:MAG TPA: metallophosphoesterase [bacterium]|nr:metallophosphoesterase [bacterium]